MPEISYRQKIRAKADCRGVDYLYHFTPAPNVPSIFKNGLLAKALFPTHGVCGYTSASHRLDGNYEACSVSISAINHSMFAKKRVDSGRADWVVLALCPSILWTHECRFFSRNAAKREMLNHGGFLGGPWAFDQMFEDTSSCTTFQGASYRNETGIPDALPTYSDAEVQVLEPISPKYLLGGWANDVKLAEILKVNLSSMGGPERGVIIRDFSPRFMNGYDCWG